MTSVGLSCVTDTLDPLDIISIISFSAFREVMRMMQIKLMIVSQNYGEGCLLSASLRLDGSENHLMLHSCN